MRIKIKIKIIKLTRHDIGIAIFHAAEVRLAVLLLVTHACRIVRAGSTGEAVEVAVVLVKYIY